MIDAGIWSIMVGVELLTTAFSCATSHDIEQKGGECYEQARVVATTFAERVRVLSKDIQRSKLRERSYRGAARDLQASKARRVFARPLSAPRLPPETMSKM